MHILLAGCFILLLTPLFFAATAWLVLNAINYLYPSGFLNSWGFWHYAIAGYLISFVSSIFKNKVSKD